MSSLWSPCTAPQVAVEECVEGKPTVVVTRPGLHPSLPSILLNSHTDVVPVSGAPAHTAFYILTK